MKCKCLCVIYLCICILCVSNTILTTLSPMLIDLCFIHIFIRSRWMCMCAWTCVCYTYIIVYTHTQVHIHVAKLGVRGVDPTINQPGNHTNWDRKRPQGLLRGWRTGVTVPARIFTVCDWKCSINRWVTP